MAILLTILGKILFVLLVILCIALFLLCSILFCPIRYKVFLESSGEFMVRGTIRWFFFVIYLPFSYQQKKFDMTLRVFGIPFFGGKREKGAKKGKSKKKAETLSKEDGMKKEEEKVLEPDEDMKEKEKAPEPDEAVKKPEPQKTSKKRSGKNKNKEPGDDASKEKKGRFQSVFSVFGKIREKKEWLGETRVFFAKDTTKEMVCILKNHVVYLFKKLKPKVIKGQIEFGTGDPCQTGQILGGLACLYAYYGEEITIIPDFTEKKLLGQILIKGRFSLIVLVIILIRILLSRNWRKFRKEIKALKGGL